MIIEKHTLFYTDREKDEIDRLSDEVDTLVRRTLQIVDILVPDESGQLREEQINAAAAARKEGGELSTQLRALTSRLIEIDEAAVTRYITSFKGNLGAITADIKEVLSAVTKEDYKSWANSRSKLSDENERKQYRAGYKSCYLFMLYVIRVQHRAISEAGFDEETAKDLASSRAQDFYKKPQGRKGKPSKEETEKALNPAAGKEGYSKMLSGPLTTKFALTTNTPKRTKKDLISGLTIVTDPSGGLKLFSEIEHELGVFTQKTFHYLTLLLTKQVTYKKEVEAAQLRVSGQIDEFMSACGIPITPSSRDKTRKQLNKSLNYLYEVSFDYKDWDGTPNSRTRLISHLPIIKNNEIKVTFSLELAEILANSFIMQYSEKLLMIDNRNPNAYRLGLYLNQLFSNFSNQRRRRNNIVSVKSALVSCVGIPTEEEVRLSNARSLTHRIIVPFEKALDALSEGGVLTWEYCNAKGNPLTDEQIDSGIDEEGYPYLAADNTGSGATIAKNWETFINSSIKFNFLNFPDQTEERAANKAKIDKAKKRKESRELAKLKGLSKQAGPNTKQP